MEAPKEVKEVVVHGHHGHRGFGPHGIGRVGYGVGYRGNAPGHHFGLPTISKETVHADKPAPKEEAPKEEAPKEVKKVVIHGHHGPHAFGHHGFGHRGFGHHGMGHRGYGVGYRGNAP